MATGVGAYVDRNVARPEEARVQILEQLLVIRHGSRRHEQPRFIALGTRQV
jgi:hypothetical protein